MHLHCCGPAITDRYFSENDQVLHTYRDQSGRRSAQEVWGDTCRNVGRSGLKAGLYSRARAVQAKLKKNNRHITSAPVINRGLEGRI